MDFDVRRIDWQNPSQPVTGGTRANWAHIDTIVLHYTAAANVPDGDGGIYETPEYVFPYVRAVQNDYVTNRGYSIGYNAAVDRWERRWQLRGDDIQCAANVDHNDHTFAILVLQDAAKPASKQMVRAIRELIIDATKLAKRSLKVVGHGQLKDPDAATACPGAGILKQIKEGFFNVTEDLVDYLVDENGDYVVDSQGNFIVLNDAPPVDDGEKMLVIVGIDENHDDPHRYVSDGLTARWIESEDEFARIQRYFKLHPDACTLQNPAWWPKSAIKAMGGKV